MVQPDHSMEPRVFLRKRDRRGVEPLKLLLEETKLLGKIVVADPQERRYRSVLPSDVELYLRFAKEGVGVNEEQVVGRKRSDP